MFPPTVCFIYSPFLSSLLFFLSSLVLCLWFGWGGTSQKAEPNTDLQPVSQSLSNNNPWSPLLRQSRSGTTPRNYVMCCIKRLSHKCQHRLPLSVSLSCAHSCLSHTLLSVPSARKSPVNHTLGPRGPTERCVCDPRFTEESCTV